jgi:hypothetical protein
MSNVAGGVSVAISSRYALKRVLKSAPLVERLPGGVFGLLGVW